MATVPEAKDALNRFKMEAASEVGVHSHLENSKTTVLSQILTPEKSHCRCSITSKTTENRYITQKIKPGADAPGLISYQIFIKKFFQLR